MVLEGRSWKDGRHWLIEVPALDVTTQGTSLRDAYRMVKDAIGLLVNKRGFKLTIHPFDRELFYVESSDEGALLALILKRQRAKHNLSLTDMAQRLKTKSKNAYAQYEQGRSLPSLSKVQEFLPAMCRRAVLTLNVIEG